MRYLILTICSLLMVACSTESDKSQPLCDHTSTSETCLSQHKAELTQCYSDICSQQTSITVKGLNKRAQKRVLYKPDTKLYKGVEKAIHNKINFSQKISKKLIQTYMKYLKKVNISLTKKQKAALNRSFFMNFYKTAFKNENPFMNLMATNLDGAPSVFVPSKKTLDLLPLRKEDKEWVLNVLKTNSFKGLPRHYLPRYHGTAYIVEEYPNVSLEEAIFQAASECISTHKKVKAKLGIPFPMPQVSQAEICHRVLKKPKSIINMNLFTQQLQQAKVLKYFFDDSLDEVWLTRDVSVQKTLKAFSQSPLFKIIKSYNFIDLEKSDQAKNYIKTSIQKCHAIIGNAYETAPTKKQRRQVQRAIEGIKSITKEKFYFSNLNMKNHFESKIDEISFKFPLFGVDYANEVLDAFDVWLKDLKAIDNIKSERSLLTALLLFSSTDFRRSKQQQENTQGIVSLREVEGLCSIFASPTYNDHHYSPTGHISISWNVIKHLDIGFGAIAHEIGHAVSSILKNMKRQWPGKYYGGLAEKNPIWERRACVDRFHSHQPHALLEENQYTEEDWADVFSTNIINDYKRDEVTPKNYMCPLVQKMDLLSEGSSSHPSRVFRAIHVHKNINGKLPASCMEAMERKKMPSCF